MFIETVKRQYVRQLATFSVTLAVAGAALCHLLLPGGCFACYPVIPVFFCLFGFLHIRLFVFGYRLGAKEVALTYLVCKVLKFVLSTLLLAFYGFVIGRDIVAFTTVFIVFYFAYLIFETRFFLRFEAKLKLSK